MTLIDTKYPIGLVLLLTTIKSKQILGIILLMENLKNIKINAMDDLLIIPRDPRLHRSDTFHFISSIRRFIQSGTTIDT